MGARSTGNYPTTTKADGHLLEYFRSDMGSGGGGTNASPGVFSASGGTETAYTGYKVHTFLTPGSFIVESAPDSFTCDILVVGGGGAGGSGNNGAYEAGGGGAGGMRTFPGQSVGSGTFTVTVGSGGVANQTTLAPNYGGYSELGTPSPLRSEGGGVGGMSIIAGLSYGGSGGGGRRSSTGANSRNNHVAGPPSPEPAPAPAQGNYGGDGYSAGGSSGGGGGGGAGGQGGDAGSNAGGAGGTGSQNNYRTGSNVYYAGGGGGTGFSSGGAAGGSSIGGNGGNAGTDGDTNTGSGGGAGDYDGPTDNGGNGGSGIIVIRYAT
jgi:hypothetical protein